MSPATGPGDIYAHRLWKPAREYHCRPHRPAAALRCPAASLRRYVAPGKLLRAIGARLGSG